MVGSHLAVIQTLLHEVVKSLCVRDRPADRDLGVFHCHFTRHTDTGALGINDWFLGFDYTYWIISMGFQISLQPF